MYRTLDCSLAIDRKYDCVDVPKCSHGIQLSKGPPSVDNQKSNCFLYLYSIWHRCRQRATASGSLSQLKKGAQKQRQSMSIPDVWLFDLIQQTNGEGHEYMGHTAHVENE